MSAPQSYQKITVKQLLEELKDRGIEVKESKKKELYQEYLTNFQKASESKSKVKPEVIKKKPATHYWVAIPVRLGIDETEYAIILWTSEEFKKVQKITKKSFKDEGDCCGQDQCLACRSGGLSMSLKNAKALPITTQEQLDFCKRQFKLAPDSELTSWAKDEIQRRLKGKGKVPKDDDD
jgi:hypothetical protein